MTDIGIVGGTRGTPPKPYTQEFGTLISAETNEAKIKLKSAEAPSWGEEAYQYVAFSAS